MKRWLTLAVVICWTILNGCGSPSFGKPGHCKTKEEFPNHLKVAAEKIATHEPDSKGHATKKEHYADRSDYLESYCVGINAYRDE